MNVHVVYETITQEPGVQGSSVDVVEVTIHGQYTRRTICTCSDMKDAQKVARALKLAAIMHELNLVWTKPTLVEEGF